MTIRLEVRSEAEDMLEFTAIDSSWPVVARHEGPGIPWLKVRPDSRESLAKVVREAALAGVALVPGNPRPLPDRPGGCVAFLDLGDMASVIEHSPPDQVIVVQAGMELSDLDAYLQGSGQWWPVAAAAGSLVADVVLSGDGGPLEHGFGGPRDLVLGLEVALSSGDVIKCGGRVVKNVTGYDLSKLFIGSRGCLGIVLSATLRLYARPATQRTLMWCSYSPQALVAVARRLLLTGLPLSCLELIDLRALKASAGAISDWEALCANGCPGNGAKPCALILQAHGEDTVVEEIAGEVERSASPVLGPARIVAPSCAERLWRALSAVVQTTGYSCLELAAPLSEMELLFESWWRQAGQPLWQARPEAGRLRIYAGDRSQLPGYLGQLASWTAQRRAPLVVAYPDDENEYRAARLPEPDAQAEALKRALRQQFDPAGCLNPFVLF